MHVKTLRRVILVAGLGVLASVNELKAQDQPLIESENPLLERVTKNERGIDWADMNLQFSTAANAAFKNGDFDEASFKIHRIRLEILGAFNEKFSYHFRQSFNKYTNPNIPSDNLSGQVEVAQVGWQVSPKVKLTAGKQAVQFSGYEYWVNAIQVREFSDFNNTIPAYRTGANLAYKIHPEHTLNFQVVNFRTGSVEEQFMYGVPQGVEDSKASLLGTVNWDASLKEAVWQLRYSLSYGQLAKKNNIFFFTCGNVYNKKPFLGYVDFMYSREGLDTRGYISESTVVEGGKPMTATDVEYLTTIANLDYRVSPHWNLYTKGVYEQGNVCKASENFAKGTYRRSWNVQLCAEYFPMADRELLVYLHFVHKNTHLTGLGRKWGAESYDSQRISLGLVYTLPVF